MVFPDYLVESDLDPNRIFGYPESDFRISGISRKMGLSMVGHAEGRDSPWFKAKLTRLFFIVSLIFGIFDDLSKFYSSTLKNQWANS